MTGETRANRDWHDLVAGFYVVNEETDIAVAGPYGSALVAEEECARRNSTGPLAPLRVMSAGSRL